MSEALGAAAAVTAGALAGAAVAGPVGAVVGGALSFFGGLFGISRPDLKRYGNIMKVQTTGASWQTSQQDRLGYDGVLASQTMAETDAERMESYRSMIKRMGRRWEVHPALIAAIISRESRAGHTLNNGWGDYGKAWGLMQVDVTPNGGGNIPVGAWDSEEHLNQATGILVYFIKKIRCKFRFWTREKVLKGGIAAYNMGDGSVHSYENVDENTTGRDYANDVVARAQWYKNNKNY